MAKILYLNLDSLYDEYYFTEYNLSGPGHEINILPEDREAFLAAFAAEWKKRAEALLEDQEVDDRWFAYKMQERAARQHSEKRASLS